MIVFENHGPNHGSSSYRDDSAAVHGMLVPSMTVFQFSQFSLNAVFCVKRPSWSSQSTLRSPFVHPTLIPLAQSLTFRSMSIGTHASLGVGTSSCKLAATCYSHLFGQAQPWVSVLKLCYIYSYQICKHCFAFVTVCRPGWELLGLVFWQSNWS